MSSRSTPLQLLSIALFVGCAPPGPSGAERPDRGPPAADAGRLADGARADGAELDSAFTDSVPAGDGSTAADAAVAPPDVALPGLDMAQPDALDGPDAADPPDASPGGDPACRAGCARASACNLVVFAECMQRCATPVDDPLAIERAAERAACAAAAPDCPALDRCLTLPPAEPWTLSDTVDPPLCAAIDACVPGGCSLVEGMAEGRPVALACVAALVDGGCPGDPVGAALGCLDADARACARLCTARATCEGVDPDACAADCEARALRGTDAQRALQVAELGCGPAMTCAELDACREAANPAGPCAAHCDRLEACDALPEGCDGACCRARCADDEPLIWHARWRACVAGAAECADVVECAPGPRLPCAARCAVERACGRDDGLCESRCADESVVDVDRAARVLACVVESPTCRSAAADCLDGPSAGSCRDQCVARVGCDAAPDVLGACIEGCGRGDAAPWGPDPVCVGDRGGECPEEVACPALDGAACVDRCARAAACGAAVGPDCAAACADDRLLPHVMAEAADCIDAAEGCDAVARCLEPPPPPAAIDDPRFCARLGQCPALAGVPCELALDLVGEGPIRACVYDGLVDCPDDPFVLLDACRDAAAAADEACDRHCRAGHACGVIDDLGMCRRACRLARLGGDPAPDGCAGVSWCGGLDGCAGP